MGNEKERNGWQEGLWVLGMAAGWGIPFYLIMIGLMKVSEKMADKKTVKKEIEDEE